MSNRGKGLLGVLALTLGALGAAELAFGQDLANSLQLSVISVSNHDVNRTGKADRAPRVTTPITPTQTVSVTLSGLTDTSVVMRIPVATPLAQDARQDTRNGAPAPLLTTRTTPSYSKPAVACEPVVSVLTDVAKQLQPGRCVT
jgi:hypothetical protein